MFIMVMIILAVVTLRYTVITDYTADDGLHYAPTDTRIIPVSSTFCEGLELSMTNSDPYNDITATLSILDSRPSLTGNETFSVHDNPYLVIDDSSHYYYYLYPGSNFSLSVCISDESGSGTFYLIKGHSNYNRWVNNYDFPTMDSFPIDAVCNGGNNTYARQIQKEDYYYLVFHGSLNMLLDIHMSFYRTRYKVAANASTNDSCSVSGRYNYSCSVSIPLSSKTAFLVVTPVPGTLVDWTSGIGLDTTCAPRVWVYVLIALSSFVGLVALIVLISLLMCVVIKYRKKKNGAVGSSNAPLLGSSPGNPHLQQPTYGSNGSDNYVAPPMYKP